jgi:HD-GYP domain-containing protein (c-di-GMP phosphodiesterase class II)
VRDPLFSAVGLAAELTRTRDADTGVHLDRVSRYAVLVARGLERERPLPAGFVEDLAILASAHDVGKIAIPDRILLKQGTLDAAEREIIQGHVASGMAVVDDLIRAFGLGDGPRVAMLRNLVRAHHEALDGSGYPHGLRGEEIPLEARIVAVADVFDALTTHRPYKRTWSTDEALAFLTAGVGTRFDPACVAALVAHASEAESIRLQA